MNASQLILSPDALSAWLLRQLIEDTTPADETVADAHTRSGTIIEIFKSMAPADASEAMVACHCIQLRFSARAALRDAEAPGQDARTQKAMRASAVSISRELRVWMNKVEKAKSRFAQTAEPRAATPGPAPRPEVAAGPSTPPSAPAPARQTPPPPAPAPRSTPPATVSSPVPGARVAPPVEPQPVTGAVPVIASG